MKKALFVTLLSLCLGGVAQAQSKHGADFDPQGAISTQTLQTQMDEKNAPFQAKVTGQVASVCQMSGCWMTLKLTDGQTMRVTFKDYGFFVPKNISGKTVVIEGQALVKETSVKTLQHYAEDAGKSKAEIAKITQPEKALNFVATGVVVQ
jgi:hypothetical protein